MFRAVVFDLLTALLDSWTLWNSVAGSGELGHAWRAAYLELTYGAGAYRPYEDLVRAAAAATGLAPECAEQLTARWGELRAWPGVMETLAGLRGRYRLGIATNCSEALGLRAAEVCGPFDAVVTSERAGFYKPHPQPYLMVLDELGVRPEETLFVAGSPFDIPGAAGVGMRVFWHNHRGLAARPGPFQAAAEGREFGALAGFLSGV